VNAPSVDSFFGADVVSDGAYIVETLESLPQGELESLLRRFKAYKIRVLREQFLIPGTARSLRLGVSLLDYAVRRAVYLSEVSASDAEEIAKFHDLMTGFLKENLP